MFLEAGANEVVELYLFTWNFELLRDDPKENIIFIYINDE